MKKGSRLVNRMDEAEGYSRRTGPRNWLSRLHEADDDLATQVEEVVDKYVSGGARTKFASASALYRWICSEYPVFSNYISIHTFITFVYQRLERYGKKPKRQSKRTS